MPTRAERRFYRRPKLLSDVERVRAVAPSPYCDGQLRAAATLVDLTPAFGLRLGGFGPIKGRAAQRMLGRLYATVLLLDDGSGHRMLFIACDLHAGVRYITEHVAAQLAEPLGLKVEDVWMTASHCHAGPGHIYAEQFYDYFTSRGHGFDRATVSRIILLLIEAALGLKDEWKPARLGVGSEVAWKLFWNRSSLAALANNAEDPEADNADVVKNPLQTHEIEYGRRLAERLSGVAPRPLEVEAGNLESIVEHLGRSCVDPLIRVIHVTHAEDIDQPIATIALMHATPTVIRAQWRCMTGDVAGYAAAMIRRQLGARYPVNITAGAMADVNVVHPNMDILKFRQQRQDDDLSDETQLETLHVTAEYLAIAICAAMERAKEAARTDVPIATKMGEWRIADAPLRDGSRLADAILVGKKTFAGSELLRTIREDSHAWFEESSYDKFKRGRAVVRRASTNPQHPKGGFWERVFTEIVGQVGSLFSGAHRMMTPWAQIRVATLGDCTLVGWPAEPSIGIYEQLRHRMAAQLSSPERFFFFGLTSGYLGYATTVMEYRVQDYEGASTYWGRRYGDWLVEKTHQLCTEPESAEVFPRAEFRTLAVHDDPMNFLGPSDAPLTEHPLERSVIDESARVGGRWVADATHSHEHGTRALGDQGYGTVIALVAIDEHGRERPCEDAKGNPIDDAHFPFVIVRERNRNGSKILWTAYAMRNMLPDLALQDSERLDFRVVAGGIFAPI